MNKDKEPLLSAPEWYKKQKQYLPNDVYAQYYAQYHTEWHDENFNKNDIELRKLFIISCNERYHLKKCLYNILRWSAHFPEAMNEELRESKYLLDRIEKEFNKKKV